jgi:filamentous hemagglutinin family protein
MSASGDFFGFFRMKKILLAAAISSALAGPALAAPASNALPTGEQVVGGSASVSRPADAGMRIDQTSARAIINWQSFSIGAGARVDVTQPTTSSVLLNRVLGNSPTEIFGQLNANGQVFLVNPNGVLFAPGASVAVGGLFASSLAITDQDFMTGQYRFARSGTAGDVINQGEIVALNGYAALAGPRVRNEGRIVANLGTVALAAGDRVTLDMVGDGLINVSVSQSALNASAVNTGILRADGGKVLMTARTAHALLDTVINTSGAIRANRMSERDGVIVLDANGRIDVDGILEASGGITINESAPTVVGGGGPVIPPHPDSIALAPSTRTITAGGAINWQSFNISSEEEAVQFVQSAGTVSLTTAIRTTTTANTTIHGSLMLTNQVGQLPPLQHSIVSTGVTVPTDAFFSLK